MTYPLAPGGLEAARRRIEFDYGAAGGGDDRISRLEKMSSGYGTLMFPVAEFSYAGVYRRAAMSLGSGAAAITADLRAPSGAGQPVGLTGLDMFGRLRDLHYRNTATLSGETLFRAEHGYDVSGDRLYDRVSQAMSPALGSQSTLDGRSQVHGYDELHRLVETKIGQVVGLTSVPPAPSVPSPLRTDTWHLDLLGNWQPDVGTSPPGLNTGRTSSGNLDGYFPSSGVALAGGTDASGSYAPWQDGSASADAADDDLQLAPMIDQRNEVTSVLTRTTLSSPFGPSVVVRHDAAGNLIFDGTYVYQYDCWDRLVQVNAGAVNPNDPVVAGLPYRGLVIGPDAQALHLRRPWPPDPHAVAVPHAGGRGGWRGAVGAVHVRRRAANPGGPP